MYYQPVFLHFLANGFLRYWGGDGNEHSTNNNLNEVLDALLAYIDNENITIDELMQYIPGPDFPTAALINGRKGIEEVYRTGRGKVYVRARASVENYR